MNSNFQCIHQLAYFISAPRACSPDTAISLTHLTPADRVSGFAGSTAPVRRLPAAIPHDAPAPSRPLLAPIEVIGEREPRTQARFTVITVNCSSRVHVLSDFAICAVYAWMRPRIKSKEENLKLIIWRIKVDHSTMTNLSSIGPAPHIEDFSTTIDISTSPVAQTWTVHYLCVHRWICRPCFNQIGYHVF